MNMSSGLKKLLASVVVVTAGVMAFLLTPDARGAVPGVLTKIVCNGTICGGTGPRQYRYQVTPGTNGCLRVDVGVHQIISLSNVIKPLNWNVSFLSATNLDKAPPFTNHGNFSSANGTCPLIMRWTGSLQTAPFVLAYDNNQTPHDVSWKTGPDGAFSNWAKPVGKGQGPIHSPIEN